MCASLGRAADLVALGRLARFAKCDMRLFFHQLQLWYQGSLYLPLLEERRIPELSLGLGIIADGDNVAWACHQEESLIAADTWCAERRVMPVVPCNEAILPESDDSLVADLVALVRALGCILIALLVVVEECAT